MGKTGLLRSYDQEICSFIDRNPGRDVKVRSGGVHEESREGCREGCREIYSVEGHQTGTRQAPPLANALASGSQQAAQLSPRAAPPAECHDRKINIGS